MTDDALLTPPAFSGHIIINDQPRTVAQLGALIRDLVDALWTNAAEANSDARWAYVDIQAYEDNDYDADDPAATVTLLVHQDDELKDMPWPDEWFAGRRRACCVPAVSLPADSAISKELASHIVPLGSDSGWTGIPLKSPDKGAQLALNVLLRVMMEQDLTVVSLHVNAENADLFTSIIGKHSTPL